MPCRRDFFHKIINRVYTVIRKRRVTSNLFPENEKTFHLRTNWYRICVFERFEQLSILPKLLFVWERQAFTYVNLPFQSTKAFGGNRPKVLESRPKPIYRQNMLESLIQVCRPDSGYYVNALIYDHVTVSAGYCYCTLVTLFRTANAIKT